MNALEPSSCAALAVGPKIVRPLVLNTSTIPATSGAFGPTIVWATPFASTKSASSLKFAASQNIGIFKQQIQDLREKLIHFLALLEVNIDFPDDVNYVEVEDDEYVYYVAKTPGFSYFAITGEKKTESATVTTTVTPTTIVTPIITPTKTTPTKISITTTTETPMKTHTTPKKTQVSETTPPEKTKIIETVSKKTPGFEIVLAISATTIALALRRKI